MCLLAYMLILIHIVAVYCTCMHIHVYLFTYIRTCVQCRLHHTQRTQEQEHWQGGGQERRLPYLHRHHNLGQGHPREQDQQ